jgi:hypothetical protein
MALKRVERELDHWDDSSASLGGLLRGLDTQARCASLGLS